MVQKQIQNVSEALRRAHEIILVNSFNGELDLSKLTVIIGPNLSGG